MEKRMSRDELLNNFQAALSNRYLKVFYQPQVNHATGKIIGAEALLRWIDPEFGMQLPIDFVPVLEENNLIHDADLFVFEEVCKFQKNQMDAGLTVVPISVNMSRYDFYGYDYPAELEEIRLKYGVPVKMFQVEITESSAIGGIQLVKSVMDKLHSYGYLVEMDDFGSGYSSLNVLKDLNVDIIKLDMNFLRGNIGGRGGVIISTVIQMAKWLDTTIIAEGVETLELADFMKSLGCIYVQGYLYFRPLPEDEFVEALKKLYHEPLKTSLHLIDTLDAGKFWDPISMETLIFNNYVGGAVIFSYEDGEIEINRYNDKYITEIGMNLDETDILKSNPWDCLDESNKKIYEDTLKKAIESRSEETCETWRNISSKCCGDDTICVRSFIRLIGYADNQYLFYAMVQNITKEKHHFNSIYDNEVKLEHAFEHANIYAWEYTIATKQMRPCFRCMRDLGLPPVIEDYPEPVIASGLFQPDYADMYRDWHDQIANGVESLDAIMPLTAGRVPFHVRYTTEFDENGKPIKAYGSATLVVNDKSEES